ncbi:hypothetical protein [Orenia marismortui]|uniref:Uncharacterized protein n=1 Tax=Orenia marismortui TaxID=46469 RepID=A0A4R8H1L8_9FIRM|nr:hypothetical protein [Orenia marismortui]TDX48921.1 hypothetical protein C7959_12432 [Orenia marismortui]
MFGIKDTFDSFRRIWGIIAIFVLGGYRVTQNRVWIYVGAGLTLLELTVEIIYFILYKEAKRLGKTFTGYKAYIGLFLYIFFYILILISLVFYFLDVKIIFPL